MRRFQSKRTLHALPRTSHPPDSDLAATALRWVMMIMFSRDEVHRFLPGTLSQAEVALWPSTLYRLAAEEIMNSGKLWTLCEATLNLRLGSMAQRWTSQAPWEISRAFHASRECMSGKELAAILWALLSRREAGLRQIIGRILQETHVLAGRYFGSFPARPDGKPHVDQDPHQRHREHIK